MRCEEAVPAVVSLVVGESPDNKRQVAHVSTCLRCQATVARDRRLRRSLADLRGAVVTPRPQMLPELLLAVRDAAADEAAASDGRTRRALYLGGAAVAAAAAGGVAVALTIRRRPQMRWLSGVST